MAINLASKVSSRIASVFVKGSLLKGHTSNEYEFTGVKTIKILTPTTVEEGNYDRNASGNRYGTPTEMQDTVQEMTLSQDKSASMTIDKGNNKDQMNLKGAGKMLKLQVKERTIPAADKYAFGQFAKFAGIVKAAASALSKGNVVEEIMGLTELMDDAEVPDEERYLYITPEAYKYVKLSPEFTGIRDLGRKSVGKGDVGELDGMTVIKVPKRRMPDNCYAIVAYKGSVLFPFKIQDAKYHQDPPGISGDLLETRHYYDAFVIGARKHGVAALYKTGMQAAAPTIAHSSNSLTITSTGSTLIKYTIDGSDPMFSSTALAYSAAVSTSAWEKGTHKVRAVAWREGGYGHSEEATYDITIA